MVSMPTQFQATPAAAAPAAAPDALASVKQQLANKPLNASRVVELGRKVHGTEGASIGVPTDRLVSLKTGNPVLDQANETASEVSKFSIKSVVDVTRSTIKGGAYGSISGALVGGLMFLAGDKWGKVAVKRLLWIPSVAAIGGVMGAGLRGFQEFKKKMNTGVDMMFKGSTPPQQH